MHFPLHGRRLIEASAGTGKTFTIASLYLRLLLGHGGDASFGRPLSVAEILVVTFTEAATEELRDRIRLKIHDARLAFEQAKAIKALRGVDSVTGDEMSDDQTISGLIDDTAADDYQEIAALLLIAERQMDEAAIYTIHGFCQRMLTQHAFESGSYFEQTFVTDLAPMQQQVVDDYWRRFFYPLSAEHSAMVQQIWPTPEKLYSVLRPYLHAQQATVQLGTQKQLLQTQDESHSDDIADSLAPLFAEACAAIDALKAVWHAAQADLFACIDGSGIDKRSYSKKHLPNWLAKVSDWAQSPTQSLQWPDELARFSQRTLVEKTKKGEAPQHACFDAIDAFLDNPPKIEPRIWLHALRYSRQALADEKARLQLSSFDDLLTRLARALQSEQGAMLAARIQQLYPVAMIDEFQDTDPLQYQIFSRIYQLVDSALFSASEQDESRSHAFALLMIGDPKQAIYAFRGADIFTYMQARQAVQAQYTLGTNWRSSQAMIDAVNTLFASAPKPFIYDDAIPFLPVSASDKGKQKYWTLNGKPQAALSCWLATSDAPISKGRYDQEMAEGCASQIHQWLVAGQQGQALLCAGEKQKAVTPGRIAVLVRTGREAQLVQQALAARNIASVYLSNRDSVFMQAEAADLYRILMAAHQPQDERLLRAAVATPLFAQSAQQLDQLNHDELAWEQVVHEFYGYRQQWRKHGVMPMLRLLMSHRGLAEQLLTQPNGERRLTDLLHLGELLQQASGELDSDSALLRWLREQMDNPNGQHEAQQLRLASEQDLVQIVTIHKSKGLEYDLVLVPFCASSRPVDEKQAVRQYHDPEQGLTFDLNRAEVALSQAEQERLAEDLRLLYVAVTRAVYGCVLGLAPLALGRSKKEANTALHLSAIGYLLQHGQAGDAALLEQSVAQLASHPHIESVDVPSDALSAWQPSHQPALVDAQRFAGEIERNWWLSSYSSLVKQGHQACFEQAGEELALIAPTQTEVASETLVAEEAELDRNIFNFPRGAQAGTMLHSIFEQIEFTAPMDDAHNQQVIAELLSQYQFEPEWQSVLSHMVATVLSTPLTQAGLSLNQLTPSQRLVEMEFLLPMQQLSAAPLSQICMADPLTATAMRQRGRIDFAPLKGMLKGFIDLVFEHQGRYYVLDWKSNHLGDDALHYHAQALDEAMIDHRYDLQYQLYSLALHRFLQSRLPDYDYEQHFGGVYYLFLRGMDGSSDHGVFYRRPSAHLVQSLDQFFATATLPATAAPSQLNLFGE
ncbi:exodeoxyribonuclease V subunit beta [Vibrio stylophorae]